MKPQSKFDAILERKRDGGEEEKEDLQQTASSPADGRRGPGRPTGKRTNPDYAQVTAYIPKSLHDDVKIALIKEGGKEFSAIVEELLSEWMRSKTAVPSRNRKMAKE